MKQTLLKYITGDKYLWAFIIILALFSFLPVYSACSNLVLVQGKGTVFSHLGKHAFFLIVGLGIMLLIQNINYKYMGGIAVLAIVPTIGLLLLTLLTGGDISGANAARWLKLPGTNYGIQTSTFASLVLLVYVARYLTKIRNQQVKIKDTIWQLFLPIITVIGLIFPANGSTAIILLSLCLIMLFLGRYPMKYLITIGLIAVVLGGLFVTLAFTMGDQIKNTRVHTWKARIESFVGKDGQSQESYQVKQAKSAIVNGGEFGKGPGKSALKQTLPQSSSDFIFAIVIEEYGSLIGGVGLIFVFLMILFRILLIATKIHTYFGTLLVLSAGLPIIFQAFINMGVAVNLFPVTGQPLPMISMGGTSLWVTCIAFGIVLSVSSQIKNQDEIEEERKRNSEAVIEDIA